MSRFRPVDLFDIGSGNAHVLYPHLSSPVARVVSVDL
jgi:hypothetical protein